MDYKYYVYVRPGEIYYFDDFGEAVNRARYYCVVVKEMGTDRIVYDGPHGEQSDPAREKVFSAMEGGTDDG